MSGQEVGVVWVVVMVVVLLLVEGVWGWEITRSGEGIISSMMFLAGVFSEVMGREELGRDCIGRLWALKWEDAGCVSQRRMSTKQIVLDLYLHIPIRYWSPSLLALLGLFRVLSN